MSTSSKFRPQNNTPLLRRTFASNSRQQKRRQLRLMAWEQLAKQHRRGMMNTPQWPMEMPRRVRRLITRRIAKRVWQEQRTEQVKGGLGLPT